MNIIQLVNVHEKISELVILQKDILKYEKQIDDDTKTKKYFLRMISDEFELSNDDDNKNTKMSHQDTIDDLDKKLKSLGEIVTTLRMECVNVTSKLHKFVGQVRRDHEKRQAESIKEKMEEVKSQLSTKQIIDNIKNNCTSQDTLVIIDDYFLSNKYVCDIIQDLGYHSIVYILDNDNCADNFEIFSVYGTFGKNENMEKTIGELIDKHDSINAYCLFYSENYVSGKIKKINGIDVYIYHSK